MCEISYSGDDNPANTANYTSVTINGETRINNKFLDDFGSLTDDINMTLSNASISCAGVLVTTSTDKSDIAVNTGYVDVFIQILYPSVELTGNIEININGTPQTFNFTKIPTS